MSKYNPPPSQYLRACDLPQNEDKVLTIRSIEQDDLRQDDRTVRKTVLRFAEVDEGLLLNRGNGRVICELYGDEMDEWVGKTLTLYVDPNVEYNGAHAPGIRIRQYPVPNRA